jgi:dipeptidyl aminopeptidase/acylaminoacyl peptidase
LYQKNSNGAGEDELLFKSDQNKTPTSWSRDGRFLLYHSIDPKTRSDLWALPLEGERKPTLVLRTEFNEAFGSISPDSRWIAYASDESGRLELYVRPFSAPGAASSAATGKWQVSKAGAIAARPVWRGDGKELFYVAPDRRLMSVEITSGSNAAFSAGVPQPLFIAPAPNWDAAADGKRFLFVTPLAESEQTSISVMLNWTTLLKN